MSRRAKQPTHSYLHRGSRRRLQFTRWSKQWVVKVLIILKVGNFKTVLYITLNIWPISCECPFDCSVYVLPACWNKLCNGTILDFFSILLKFISQNMPCHVNKLKGCSYKFYQTHWSLCGWRFSRFDNNTFHVLVKTLFTRVAWKLWVFFPYT